MKEFESEVTQKPAEQGPKQAEQLLKSESEPKTKLEPKLEPKPSLSRCTRGEVELMEELPEVLIQTFPIRLINRQLWLPCWSTGVGKPLPLLLAANFCFI